MEIRRNFFEQLKFLAERIVATGPVSDRWDQTMALGEESAREEVVLKNTFLNSRRDESMLSDNNWNSKKGKRQIKSGTKKKKSGSTSNQGGSVSPAPQKKKPKGLKWADEGTKPKPLITDFYGPIFKGQKLFRDGMSAARTILKNKNDPKENENLDNSSVQGGNTPPRGKPRRLLQTEEDNSRLLVANSVSTPTGPRNNISSASQPQSGSYVNGQLLRPSNSAKRLESGQKKNSDSNGTATGASLAGPRSGSEKRKPYSNLAPNGQNTQNEISNIGPQTSLLSGLPPRTGNLISNTPGGKPPTGKNPAPTNKRPVDSSIRKEPSLLTPQQQFFPTYTLQSSSTYEGAAANQYYSNKVKNTATDSPYAHDLRDSNEFSGSQGSAKKRPASTGSSSAQTNQRTIKDDDKLDKNTANNSKNR